MKRIILMGLACLFLCSCTEKRAEFSVGTFNIHLAPKEDSNAWQSRKDSVAALVRFHDLDIFGTQEGFLHQVNDIVGKDGVYNYYGVGREDGNLEGETSAVIYKPSKFELLDKGSFWFAETPDKPVKGWDAQCKRICSWGKFKDRQSGKVFYFFSLHFDHMGKTAQLNSAKQVNAAVKNIAGNTPAIVVGDFNVMPSSEVYAELKNGDVLKDSYLVSKAKPYGVQGTYHGYAGQSPQRLQDRIDYIFVTKSFDVEKIGTLTDRIMPDKSAKGKVPSSNADGTHGIEASQIVYPSDHFPVKAVLILK